MTSTELKPALLVLSEEEAFNIDMQPGYVNTDRNLGLLSLDEVGTFIDKGVLFPKTLSSKDIVIENPFEPKEYIKVDPNTPFELRKQKYNRVMRIATILGAKRCNIIELEGFYQKREMKLDSNGKVKGFKGKFEMKKEEIEKAMQLYSKEIECNGEENTSDDAYQKALQYAKAHGLDRDTEVMALLDERNPFYGNPTKKSTLKFHAQSEVNELMDIAFSCMALKKVFSIDANFKSTFEKRESFTLTMEFVFP